MSEELSDDKLFDDVMNAEVSTKDVQEHRKQTPIKDTKAQAEDPPADEPAEDEGKPAWLPDDLDALQQAMEAGKGEEEVDENGQRVPLAELRKEREKRQALEDRLKELETSGPKPDSALQARIDQLERLFRQQPQPAQKPEDAQQPPDFWEDPLSHLQTIQQTTADAMHNMRVQFSMDLAETKYGEEFGTYFEQVKSDPRLAARAYQSPNPGEEIMRIGRESKFMTETGGDLDKYGDTLKQKLLDDPEFQREVIERVQKSLGGAAPANPGHIPASVSSGAGQQQGNTRQGRGKYADMSDDALFAAIDSGQI